MPGTPPRIALAHAGNSASSPTNHTSRCMSSDHATCGIRSPHLACDIRSTQMSGGSITWVSVSKISCCVAITAPSGIVQICGKHDTDDAPVLAWRPMAALYYRAPLSVTADVAWDFLDRYTRAEVHVFS